MTTLARTTRHAVLVAVLGTALLVASCTGPQSFPDRAPDAAGTLTALADPGFAPDPGQVVYRLTVDQGEYPYYFDATLTFDGDTVVGDQLGGEPTLDDLQEGLWVEVWTDACRESYPVQCDVTHVRLTRVD